MMVQTGTHLGISICLRGWAILPGHRSSFTVHLLSPHHLPPNVHLVPLPPCHPWGSTIEPIPHDNNAPWYLLSPPRTQKAHSSTPQDQVEAGDEAPCHHNETTTQSSPSCPFTNLPQDRLLRRINFPPPACLVVITLLSLSSFSFWISMPGLNRSIVRFQWSPRESMYRHWPF